MKWHVFLQTGSQRTSTCMILFIPSVNLGKRDGQMMLFHKGCHEGPWGGWWLEVNDWQADQD